MNCQNQDREHKGMSRRSFLKTMGIAGVATAGLSACLGGNARMMVLIDGHPQYAGIFGHPIADAYQSFLADKVEVLRGPASVLYGSNAMGGVVNIITHFNATYPGPISAPLLEGDQRITRGVASASISNNYSTTSGAVSFFYNWGKHWINDGYTPSAGESPQEGRFHSTDNMMGVSLYQSFQLFHGNRTTFGADWFRYGGKAYTKYVKGERKGTSNDLVDKHETELAGYADFRQDVWQWFTFNAGLRIDHHSQIGTEFVPQVGLAFHLPYNMELKTSATKGFSYPILREMYMFHPQNPDLKPESMWNYELAISQNVLEGDLRYGINLFYIDGKNIIMTLPNPNGSGRINQNSGKIYNSGFELQLAYRINRHWSSDANYSYLHMTNPVIAAPKHKLHIGANFTAGCWEIATGLQYIAEINAGYPMPWATIMGGMNIHL